MKKTITLFASLAMLALGACAATAPAPFEANFPVQATAPAPFEANFPVQATAPAPFEVNFPTYVLSCSNATPAPFEDCYPVNLSK